MRMRIFAALMAVLATLWLGGCDTAPQMSPSSIPAVAADKARFFFYRDSTVYDSLLWTAISLDGESVGSLGPGQVFYRDVAPGTYRVSVRSDQLYPGQVKTVAARPGNTIFVRVADLPFWGQSAREWRGTTFVPTVIDPAIGQIQIAKLRLTSG